MAYEELERSLSWKVFSWENDLPCINKNLERTFQHKIFQLDDFSNYMHPDKMGDF